MNSGEIRCSLCGLRKPLGEYSKSSRKLQDPCCKRCVAWTETQEPDIIPAPLETGHVSVEERSGGYWDDDFRTGEDFLDSDLMPRAPITSASELGIEDGEDGDIYADQILSRNCLIDLTDTQSTTTAPSYLPPQLKSQSGNSSVAPSSSVSETGESTTSSLPLHLLKVSRASESISTATTVRHGREERQRSREVQYNAYGPDGVPQQRTRIPTDDSSATSRTTSRDASTTRSARRPGGAWPDVKPERTPLPGTQHEIGTLAARNGARKLDKGRDSQRRLGFCNSDEDSGDDY